MAGQGVGLGLAKLPAGPRGTGLPMRIGRPLGPTAASRGPSYGVMLGFNTVTYATLTTAASTPTPPGTCDAALKTMVADAAWSL